MRKIILALLFVNLANAQKTTVHFYYGTANNVGSEIMFHLKGTESTYLGGGFSGAWKQQSVSGKNISEYDKRQLVTQSIREEWCSIYAVGSCGFLGSVLIKYRGGLSVYNDKFQFNEQYWKLDKAVFKPLIGASAMYSITKDYGIEAGIDTFNKVTIGFTANF